jgi:TonB family protein
MNKLITITVFASACATTGRSLPIESGGAGMAPTFDTRLAGSANDDTAKAWFPMLASDAVLPSVAHYQRELSTDRDRYELAVRLCVAPNGSVSSVDLKQGSGSAELDRAAAHDIAQWQFEAFTAPANIRVCKQLSLAYDPHAEMSHIRIPLVRMSQP